MFEALQDGLGSALKTLRGQGKLTESNMRDGLKLVEKSLLEADVSFTVVRDFMARVGEQAVGEKVLKALNPSQQVVGIVYQELINLMGPVDHSLHLRGANDVTVLMMCGLQGSGKTTTTGKLARMLARQGRFPLVVSTDVRRPAAIEQLSVVAGKAGVRVFNPAGILDPIGRARGAMGEARNTGCDVVIVDTAGRLHIDDELMRELVAIKDVVEPSDLLYVADAMTGQDAIKSAGEFNRQVGVTGVVLSKIDGDARGGAALSVVSVVGVPIAFVGAGERLEDLEAFHADRFVSRLLGMGDVLSLIERAEEVIDARQAEDLEQKIRKNSFSLGDFRDQLRTIRKMGPLEHIMKLLPGMGQLKALGDAKPDERQLRRVEAIINSMTAEERDHAEVIDGSRRKRIAKGSGTSVEDVNRLLKQYAEMRKMLKMVGQMTGEAVPEAPKKRKKKGPFSLMK
jgi:signal recognition particle subunit SRP54